MLEIKSQRLQALKSAIKCIVPKRCTLPVLQSAHVEGAAGQLRAVVSDANMTAEIILPAVGDLAPSLIPADVLCMALDRVDALQIEGDTLTTAAGRRTFKALSADAYPNVPMLQEISAAACACTLEASPEEFAYAFHAASKDATKPTLSALAIDLAERNGHGPALVSTDGFRLAVIKLGTAPAMAETSKPVMLRADEFKALQALRNGCEPILFHWDDYSIAFSGADWRLSIRRRLEGNFPAWQKVMPGELPNETSIERATLGELTKRAGAAADEYNKNLKLFSESGKLAAWLEHPDNGTSAAACAIDGQDLPAMALNHAYLSDLAKVAPADTLVWHWKNGRTQFSIQAGAGQLVLLPVTFCKVEEETAEWMEGAYLAPGRAILATAEPVQGKAPKARKASPKAAPAVPSDEAAGLKAELIQARGMLAQVRAQYEGAKIESAGQGEENQELRQALQDARKALSLANDDCKAGDKARAELYEETSKLQAQLAELRDDNRRMMAQRDQALESLTQLSKELTAAEVGLQYANNPKALTAGHEMEEARELLKDQCQALADSEKERQALMGQVQALQAAADDAFQAFLTANEELQALKARPAMFAPVMAPAPAAVKVEASPLTVKVHTAGPMPASVRNELEAAGFRWSDRKAGFYWAPVSDEALASARAIVAKLAA